MLCPPFPFFAPEYSGAKNGKGGHNIKKILLTIKAFKMLCLKAGTKKADQIHEYYIKLEETLQDVINEESNELRLQLQQKESEIENLLITNEQERDIVRENTILEQFSTNVQCIYYGIIDNVSNTNEKLVKFGSSNNLSERVCRHKKIFSNFRLVNAFKVENKTHIENSIKKNPVLSKLRRTISINNIKYTELLSMEEMSYEVLDEHIKNIVRAVEYSPENYVKLLQERDQLEKKCIRLSQEIENLKGIIPKTHESVDSLNHKIMVLFEENERLKRENCRFIKKSNTQVQDEESSDITVNSIEYITVASSLKRLSRRPDGFFHIEGFKYRQCFGSREEVWNRVAYKTTGGLTFQDLIMNKHGKLVSKKKFITEKESNRFQKN